MNWIYEKLKKDLSQTRYNLIKAGLYHGETKKRINSLLNLMIEEEINSKNR